MRRNRGFQEEWSSSEDSKQERGTEEDLFEASESVGRLATARRLELKPTKRPNRHSSLSQTAYRAYSIIALLGTMVNMGIE